MRAFASIIDLFYIPLSTDCSFQFLILHFFLYSTIHNPSIDFQVFLLLEYPDADYRICCIPSFPYPSYSHDLSISVCFIKAFRGHISGFLTGSFFLRGGVTTIKLFLIIKIYPAKSRLSIPKRQIYLCHSFFHVISSKIGLRFEENTRISQK